MIWITLAVVALGVAVLLYLGRGPVQRPQTEIVRVMQLWLDDSLPAGEWDFFESCELADPGLDAVRRKCVELSLDPTYTIDPQESPALNASGKQRLREILQDFQPSNSLSGALRP
jgi:hypothetical protein